MFMILIDLFIISYQQNIYWFHYNNLLSLICIIYSNYIKMIEHIFMMVKFINYYYDE